MKWYDVDIVKGTQYTVTAYQVPIEEPTVSPTEETNATTVKVRLLCVVIPLYNVLVEISEIVHNMEVFPITKVV